MADVLFFSAHPDDAEFGAGGTLLKLAKEYKVINVILTHGEAGTYGTPEIREKEAKAAAKYANAEVEFLDFKDNYVEDTTENAMKLAKAIRKHKPKVIFAPYHTNDFSHKDGAAHPDHVALGKLARKAARFAKFKGANLPGEPHNAEKIIYFMVPKYKKPSFIINVSDIVEEIKGLWKCHESQLQMRKGKLSEHLLLQRRSTGLLNNIDYAEPFIIEEPVKADIGCIFKF